MNKNNLLLHFSAFVISFAPLFAKSISLNADIIIWWRCLLSSIVLGIILLATKKYKFPLKHLWAIIFSGLFLGLHWWTFFISIQYSSVSIGILTVFTFPLITAILEPFYTKVPVSTRQILGGLGIVSGVYFLIPEFSFENTITQGVLFGIFSALVYSFRNIITKKHLSTIPALTVLHYQIIFAFFILCFPVFFGVENFTIPSKKDFVFLLLLSTIFTVVPHGLITYCFKHFSASTVGIVISLQVVYSTILAFILLSEVPNPSFYIGAIIILSIAVYELLPKRLL